MHYPLWQLHVLTKVTNRTIFIFEKMKKMKSFSFHAINKNMPFKKYRRIESFRKVIVSDTEKIQFFVYPGLRYAHTFNFCMQKKIVVEKDCSSTKFLLRLKQKSWSLQILLEKKMEIYGNCMISFFSKNFS